jgi:nucleotide-binding universal stress UspA family protein
MPNKLLTKIFPMFQKILIAIGDTAESEQMLESGLTLAEKLSAEVLLLHVLNPLTPHGFETVASPLVGGIIPIVDDTAIRQYMEEWQKYEQRGLARLQAAAQQASNRGIAATTLQGFGDAGPMICEAAKNWAADTIVMGRNQKSTLSEIFLGSTSNYVLHRAVCSVLVIRSPITE